MCWSVSYAVLIGISTVITFLSGILISRQNKKLESGKIDKKKCTVNKKIFVAVSFTINLGILAFFKYSPMVLSTIESISKFLGNNISLPTFKYLLPVGISFYTFQALSYTVDVYRGKIEASKHFGKYALFVSFFPQLVAGPIERSTNLLPQFDEVKKFNLSKSRKAFLLILWGMFKKVVIADRIAQAVEPVFANIHANNGFTIAVATFFFAIQVYCDFSAYSNIAIGSANILGFDLMRNFKRAYFSKSIGEFWSRWHISLSTWFRDYLYIPLGGSRVSKARWVFNIMVVFVCSGLWHGARWTYVMWGAMHGVYTVIGGLTRPFKDRLLKKLKINRKWKIVQLISILITFTLFCFALMIFRVNSIPDGIYAITQLFSIRADMISLPELMIKMNASMNDIVFMFVCTGILFFVDLLETKIDIKQSLENSIWPLRWIIYFALIFSIILLGLYGVGEAAFIYFQF
jgi:D-alanyl-lipoteichoic acid acyltransferase DltB (MBOAT superfamily)